MCLILSKQRAVSVLQLCLNWNAYNSKFIKFGNNGDWLAFGYAEIECSRHIFLGGIVIITYEFTSLL